MKLICVFVFAYADCWFSHEAAQLFYLFPPMELLSKNKPGTIRQSKAKLKIKVLFFLNLIQNGQNVLSMRAIYKIKTLPIASLYIS